MSVPYIGAKISLTSRSLIRYEGILASVDPKEATISLERVRMMGTEGRRPGQDIPPSNDVYDLVVFRSSDIEDLQIFEPPIITPSKPFTDPAIVSSSSNEFTIYPNPPPLHPHSMVDSTSGGINSSGMSAGGWPAAPRLQFGTATTASLGAVAMQRPNNTTTNFGGAPSSGPNSSVYWGQMTTSMETERSSLTRPPPSAFGSLATVEVNAAPPPPVSHPQQSLTPPLMAKSAAVTTTHTAIMNSSSITNHHHHQGESMMNSTTISASKVMAYNTVTGKIEMVERQSRSYASVVSDGAGRFRLSGESTARMVPRSDYDFEQANARLQRETLPDASPKEAFYDKTTSFFDNISCEAKNLKDPKEKNERRWNIETFGVAAPTGNNNYRYYGQRRGGGSGSGSFQNRSRPRQNETLPR